MLEVLQLVRHEDDGAAFLQQHLPDAVLEDMLSDVHVQGRQGVILRGRGVRRNSPVSFSSPGTDRHVNHPPQKHDH